MELYLESMMNDLEISSMECDIALDRFDLMNNYYSNIDKLYNESGNGSEDIITEKAKRQKAVSHSIGEALINAINTVINFICDCITKVQQFFTKVQIARLQKAYDKKLKEDPTLKERTIDFIDKRAIVSERNELIRELKKSKHDEKRRKKIREREKSLAGKRAQNVVLTLGAAMVMLAPFADDIIKNMTARKKALNDAKDTIRSNVARIDRELEVNRKKRFGTKIGTELDDYTHDMNNESGHEYFSILTRMEKANTADELSMATNLYMAFIRKMQLKDDELYVELKKRQDQKANP